MKNQIYFYEDDDSEENIYRKHGYKDREDYLHSLAEEMDVKYSAVKYLADSLGPNEDFDGLVSELEDYVEMMEDDDEDLF